MDYEVIVIGDESLTNGSSRATIKTDELRKTSSVEDLDIQLPNSPSIKIIRRLASTGSYTFYELEPQERWAVVKLDATTDAPFYRVVNTRKIAGNVTTGTKMRSIDPENRDKFSQVVEIFPTQKKAEDYVKLMVYRKLGNRMNPYPVSSELRPKIWVLRSNYDQPLERPEISAKKDNVSVESATMIQDDNAEFSPDEEEVKNTFGLISKFANKPVDEYLPTSVIREFKFKAKNLKDFVRQVAKNLFDEDDQRKLMKERNQTKVLWLRKLVQKEFQLNNKLAENHLWKDCVNALDNVARSKKASNTKKDKECLNGYEYEDILCDNLF